MKILLPIVYLVGSVFCATAQDDFPEAWIGEYEGEMSIGYVDKPGTVAQVSYSLYEIIADSVWSHKMTFTSEVYGEIIKDYVIRAKAKGDVVNFILDELNGVAMEMSYMNNCFYSLFELGGNSYSTTFRRLADGTLLWDLYMTPYSTKKVDIISNGDKTEKQTFEVTSFKPSLHQTVIFEKKD